MAYCSVLVMCLIVGVLNVIADNCVLFSKPNQFKMSWNLTEDGVSFRIEAVDVKGWLSVGLYPHSMHPQKKEDWADVWMFSRSEEPNSPCNPFCILDGHMTQTSFFVDEEDNLKNKHFLANGTQWIFTFERDFQTNDEKNDRSISKNYGTQFVWALHAFTPIDTHIQEDRELEVVSHALMDSSVRGSKIIDLSKHEENECVETPVPVWSNVDGTFRLKFKVDRIGQQIHFEMSADVIDTWFAFGWGDTHLFHQNVTMYIGHVDPTTQKVFLLKGWSVAATTPNVRRFEDTFETLSGSFESGKSTIRFTRTLLTPDDDDLPIMNKDVYLSWAIGRGKIHQELLGFTKHIHSGIGVVNFYSGLAQKSVSNQQVHQVRKVWTIKSNNIE